MAYIVLASIGYNTFFTSVDLVWDDADPIGIFTYVLNLVYFFSKFFSVDLSPLTLFSCTTTATLSNSLHNHIFTMHVIIRTVNKVN